MDLQVLMDPPRATNLETKSEMLVWKPCSSLSDKDLDSFIFAICSKCSYSIEQALCLLGVNGYDVQKALMKSRQFVPTPNEWSTEDRIVFEQAYNIYGKNFYKIKQCLPDKKQGSVVNFYYMWKKTRGHVSVIQQQTEQQQNGKNIANLANNDLETNPLNGNDEQAASNETDIDESSFNNVTKICSNCDSITDDIQSTPKGVLCHLCYVYYKNTSGLMRPDNLNTMTDRFDQQIKLSKMNNDQVDTDHNKRTENAKEARNFQKSLRKPPKGIYLNYEELVNLAEFDHNITFEMLDKRLNSLKKEVQENKQYISSLLIEFTEDENKPNTIEVDPDLLKIETDSYPTPEWNSHEIALVLQAFNKYGADFEAISQVMGTKSENSIRSFYQYHKDHYNLDKLILNPIHLKSESLLIFNNLNKLNRPDLPVFTRKLSHEDSSRPTSTNGLFNSSEVSN